MILLGYTLWVQRFGADPDVVGRRVGVGGESHEIVGVMGPDFRFLSPSSLGRSLSPDAWVPGTWDFPSMPTSSYSFALLVRAKPGKRIADVQAELNVIGAAHRAGVKRLIFFASSCMYPREAPQPMAETALFSGRPEETSMGYAVAKIAGTQLCLAYNQQHGGKRGACRFSARQRGEPAVELDPEPEPRTRACEGNCSRQGQSCFRLDYSRQPPKRGCL